MQALIKRVETCFLQAEQYFGRSFVRPSLKLNRRYSKVAGSANLSLWRLSFNLHFYQQQPEHFLQHTVAHEVAHLLCATLYGRVAPHGKEWQSIMRDVFKLPAKRTHTYSLTHLPLQHFAYRCHCREHQLSLRRHNKVQRQQAQYHCRTCGCPLTEITTP